MPTDGLLEPGTYRSDEFDPSFSFGVDSGWVSASAEVPDAFAMILGSTQGLERPSVLGFYNPEAVVEQSAYSRKTLEPKVCPRRARRLYVAMSRLMANRLTRL